MGGRQSVDPLQSGCEKNRHLRADVHLLRSQGWQCRIAAWHNVVGFSQV